MTPLVLADREAEYEVQEVAVIIAALAFVIAVGGVAIAAAIICGWGGAKSVVLDWFHGKAVFNCK
jgi:hypothetical protein